MAQDLKPTRSELLKIKKQIKLAKSGHSLLKKKRDGLIIEFFKILNRSKKLRSEMVELYKVGLEKVNIARTLETDLKVKSIAMAVHEIPEIIVKKKNVMGVLVPAIESSDVKRQFMHRGYGFYGVSSSIDEAADSYEKVIEKIIVTAEIETSMKKLLNEIEKTKRRVNALEFVLIPRLEKQKSFIQMRLEEMERENVFRMKRIKTKAAA